MRRREPISPDMTPLIDVVFILLIFFLVSSTFKKDELALDLILPKSGSAKEIIKKEELSIELSRDKIALKGRVIKFADLGAELSKVSDKEKPVNIRINKDVEYQRVMKLFDLLKKYDLNNLALESEVKEQI
jgi:biopolymer transport protein ExbD